MLYIQTAILPWLAVFLQPTYSYISYFFGVAPEFVLIIGIVIFLCFVKNMNSFYINSLFFYKLLSLLLFFLSLEAYTMYYLETRQNVSLFFGSFHIDFYTLFCKIVFILFLLIIAMFSEFKLFWSKPPVADIFIPIYFFILFSLFLLSAFDLFSAYLALEGVSLTLYTLTANSYKKRTAIEATVKYFTFGGISNGLFLFGSSILFNLCGSLQYSEIKYLLSSLSLNINSIGICVSLVCFISVFLFKIAAFPCHMWSPDVYDGTWLPITTTLVIVAKLVYFFFFFRLFFFTFISLFFLWQPLILLSSFGSLIIGSFGIIGQDRVKRLMAYSSINHVSFILLGMACNSSNHQGLTSSLLYLIIYTLTLLVFFGFILNMRCIITGRSLTYLSDFSKIAQFSLFSSYSFIIILFSMGGLPPLAGFFIKLYVYIEAVSSGLYIFVFLSMLITIISTFYYLFFLKSIFFDVPSTYTFVSLNFTRNILINFIGLVQIFLVGFIFFSRYAYKKISAIAIIACKLSSLSYASSYSMFF